MYTVLSALINCFMYIDAFAFCAFQPPFPIPPVGGGAPSGPPISTRDGRIFPRTRGGRTYAGSSSRAPVPDDESEEGAESSEEEVGGSSGSGSDSDTSGDAPGLLPRKRARTDPPARGH